MLLQAIYGVISKNLLGFLSKANTGSYNFKKLAEDIGYGIVAVATIYGVQYFFGIELPEDAVSGTLVYMAGTWLIDKVIGTVYQKFTNPNFKIWEPFF